MLGIGAPELVVLVVLALIIFGPERLPEIAGQVAKAIRDFRRMSADVTSEFNRTMTLDESATAATTVVEPPPALMRETIDTQPATTAVHENGADGTHNAQTFTLTSEPLPPDPPVSNGAVTGEDTLVATKADPHAGVSLLDDDGVPVRAGLPEIGAAYIYTPVVPAIDLPVPRPATIAEPAGAPVAAVATVEADAARAVTKSAPLVYESGAAWEHVTTTDATAPPDGAVEGAATATDGLQESAVSPPEPLVITPSARSTVDPSAEVTVRETVEAQVASEAFRERRRRATYQRQHKPR